MLFQAVDVRAEICGPRQRLASCSDCACGYARNFYETYCDISGWQGDGWWSDCLTTPHPSCACGDDGGDDGICTPGEWAGCGTNGCSSGQTSQCNASGTGWNCFDDPGTCDGGGGGGGFCGDGTCGTGESCSTCSSDCGSCVTCGNGVVEGAEQCDEGAANSNAPNATCRTSPNACKRRFCGDGIVDDLFNEECDDGNTNDLDACATDCRLNVAAVPWIATTESNVYAKGGFSGFDVLTVRKVKPPISYNDYGYKYNKPPNLSEFIASLGNSSWPGAVNLSENSYLATNYTDLSSTNPKDLGEDITSWYDYMEKLVSSTYTIQGLGTNSLVRDGEIKEISTMLGLTPGQVFVARRYGNLTTDRLRCDVKGIIFVTGDLQIEPPLITNEFDNGCIFIVAGNVYIRDGTRRNPSTATLTDPTEYDRVEGAFIVDGTFDVAADTFADGMKGDGLFVKGFVIANSFLLERDLLGFNNGRQPADVFVYDPRFVGIPEFRNILDLRRFSIREF